MNDDEKKQIVSWIEESMKQKSFSKMVIDLKGTNEKGEGYAADFIFAEVTATDKDSKSKKVHLAIKKGKSSKTMRDTMPMLREIYKRELFVYDKIFPTFEKFQVDRNIVNIFDAYPKCYKTFLSDDMEALVFENLRERGFVLHNSRKPLNLQHLHLVLKNYAKLHALSFALRDQNKIEFDKLTANLKSAMTGIVVASGMFRKKENVQENLRRGGRDDLIAKYEKEFERGKETLAVEILDDVVQESVVTHGDCHNNNFLFKYKDNDEENPVSVAIIDWQNSSLHSPALDLSCFLYLCASGENLSQLKELLHFYYSHLTDFLRELGSDVGKLFPYITLVNHWKKYSVYAFIIVTSFMEMLYVEKEDVPAFENIKEQGDMGKFIEDIKLKDEDSYRERLISIVDHHLNFKLK